MNMYHKKRSNLKFVKLYTELIALQEEVNTSLYTQTHTEPLKNILAFGGVTFGDL